MKSTSTKIVAGLLLALFLSSIGICQDARVVKLSGDEERVAVLPLGTQGLSSDQARLLWQRFADALGESGRFNVLPENAMASIFEASGLKKIDSCTSLPCLAQLGKILGVVKIVRVDALHLEERYVLHIQLVDASDATLLHDEKVDFTGYFNDLLSVVVPEQANKLTTARLGTGIQWYYIAGAVLVGVGVIYWIYTTFASSSNSQTQIAAPTPGPK